MESFDPYSEWLDRPPGRPPKDHYELLGLARFEADLDLIAHTADTLRAKVRKIRPGNHPAEWRRLLDRLESAKICLSDPIAKLAYDESIDTESHKVNVTGEPNVTDESPPLDAKETQAVRSESPEFVEMPPVVGEGEGVATNDVPDAARTMPVIQASSRRSRANGLIIGALSTLVALLVVAIGYVVLTRTEVPDTAADVPSSSNTAVLNDETVDGGEPAPPDGDLADGPSPATDSQTSPPTPERVDESAVRDPTSSTEPSPPPVPAPTRPAVDPARQQAFQRSVESTRTALRTRDLASAANCLNEAVSLAQTDEELAETSRLESLRAHLDAFWGSLREQMAKLESGSAFRVRETMVVVVEASQDHVVVRASGQNLRYMIADMPGVLVAAMADQLFTKSPNAKALRASFLMVDPKGDRQQAGQLLQEASQGGAEVSKLLAELNRAE